jgi:hypothetical protein
MTAQKNEALPYISEKDRNLLFDILSQDGGSHKPIKRWDILTKLGRRENNHLQ